jgi:periplasmic protein CpxP/Spy
MTHTKNKTASPLKHLLLAAAICLPVAAIAAPDAAMPPGADGQAMPGDHDGPGMSGGPGMDMHGGPGMDMHGPFGPPPFGHGGPGGPGGPGMGRAPFLHGIELSEQQDDKVFALLHAQEPELREQRKIVEKSHEALHALATSGKYDDAKAVALTQAGAQAMARIALDQIRTEQQILAILTPEQRQKVDQRAQHMAEEGNRSPRPH